MSDPGTTHEATTAKTRLTTSQILSQAADLIEPEGAWTQGAFARTEKGHVIGSLEQPATCFCAVGAIYRVAQAQSRSVQERAVDLMSETVGKWHIGEWNDAPYRTQAEVVAALRKAALLAAKSETPADGRLATKGQL